MVDVVNPKKKKVNTADATQPVNGVEPTGQPSPDQKVPNTLVNKGVDVAFNKDNTVTLTDVAGNPQTVSREEYQALIQRSGGGASNLSGKLSPQLQTFITLNEQEKLKRTVAQRLQEGATMDQIQEELIQQKIAENKPRNEADAQARADSQAQQDAFNAEQAQAIPNNGDINGDGKLDKSERFAIRNKAGLQEAQKVFDPLVRATVKIQDVVTSAFKDGKGVEQKTAEQVYGDLKADIGNDFALVQSGLKDRGEVEQKLDRLQSAVNLMDSASKGIGKYNKNYLITDGLAVQVASEEMRQFIIESRAKLDRAQALSQF